MPVILTIGSDAKEDKRGSVKSVTSIGRSFESAHFHIKTLLSPNWNKALSFHGRYCEFESRREYKTTVRKHKHLTVQ